MSPHAEDRRFFRWWLKLVSVVAASLVCDAVGVATGQWWFLVQGPIALGLIGWLYYNAPRATNGRRL